jgi:hypothetical protein
MNFDVQRTSTKITAGFQIDNLLKIPDISQESMRRWGGKKELQWVSLFKNNLFILSDKSKH